MRGKAWSSRFRCGTKPRHFLLRSCAAVCSAAASQAMRQDRARDKKIGCVGIQVMRIHRAALFWALAYVAANGPARAADSTLIEAAKKERQVVWYTTLIVNQAIRPLKDAFEKKYPGIELQFARADESPTAAKILAEAAAGRVSGA